MPLCIAVVNRHLAFDKIFVFTPLIFNVVSPVTTTTPRHSTVSTKQSQTRCVSRISVIDILDNSFPVSTTPLRQVMPVFLTLARHNNSGITWVIKKNLNGDNAVTRDRGETNL
jgi:hypothetical protein